MIRCEEVIISDIYRRGKGTTDSPVRAVLQVYSKNGTLIAENDPCRDVEQVYLPNDLSNTALAAQQLYYLLAEISESGLIVSDTYRKKIENALTHYKKASEVFGSHN